MCAGPSKGPDCARGPSRSSICALFLKQFAQEPEQAVPRATALPEPSHSGSPPAELGVYHREISLPFHFSERQGCAVGAERQSEPAPGSPSHRCFRNSRTGIPMSLAISRRRIGEMSRP